MPDDIIDQAAISIVPDFTDFKSRYEAERALVQRQLKDFKVGVDIVTNDAVYAAKLKIATLRKDFENQLKGIRVGVDTTSAVAAARLKFNTLQQLAKDEAKAQTVAAKQAERERIASIRSIEQEERRAARARAAARQNELVEQRRAERDENERQRGRAFNLPFVAQSLPRKFALPIGVAAGGVASGLLAPALGGIASAAPVLTGAIPLFASINALLKDNATLATAAGAGWRQFKTDTEAVDMKVLDAGVGILNEFLKDVEPLTKAVGQAFAATGQEIKAALSGDEFKGIFAGFAEEARSGDIEKIGHALVEAAAAAGHMVIAFEPLIHETVNGIDGFAVALNKASQSTGFKEFVAYVQANGHVLSDLIANLGSTIGNVLPTLAELGTVGLKALNAIFQILNAVTSLPFGGFIVGVAVAAATLLRLVTIAKEAVIIGRLAAALIAVRNAITGSLATIAAYRAGMIGARVASLSLLSALGPVGIALAAAGVAMAIFGSHSSSAARDTLDFSDAIDENTGKLKQNADAAIRAALARTGSGHDPKTKNNEQASVFDTTRAVGLSDQDVIEAVKNRDKMVALVKDLQQKAQAVNSTVPFEKQAQAYKDLQSAFDVLSGSSGDLSVALDHAGQAATGAVAPALTLAEAAGKASAAFALQVAVAQNQQAVFDSIATKQKALADAQKAVVDGQKAIGLARQKAAEDSAAAARSERDAIQGVVDANKALKQAQEDARQAQLDLVLARKDARNQLAQYRKDVRDTALAEKEAKLGVQSAQEALNQARFEGNPEEIAAAELQLEESKNKSTDATDAARKAVQTLNEAERLGIERAPQVVAAKKAVRDADDRQRDAVRGVQRAEENLRLTRASNAKQAISNSDAIKSAVNDLKTKQGEYNKALAETSRTLDLNTKAGVNNIVMLTALATAIQALNQGDPIKSRAAFDLIAKQAGFSGNALRNIENNLFGGPTDPMGIGSGGTIDTTHGAPTLPANRSSNRALANKKIIAAGWGKFWPAFDALEMGEAGYNNLARNPSSGAYGIPQALPESKLPARARASGGSDPGSQIDWMINYIRGRYGNPGNAYSQWSARKPHWYSTGGRVDGPGGPRDDSIPAWLSDGEYVINAQAHKAMGTGFLDHINAKGYATGGAVTPGAIFESQTKASATNIKAWIDALTKITGRGFRDLALRLAAGDFDAQTLAAAKAMAKAPNATLIRLTNESRSANIWEALLGKLSTILKNEKSPGPQSYTWQQLQQLAGIGNAQVPFTETGLLPPGARVLFDGGGLLPAGATSVMNKTGRPEAVLTERQWQAIYTAATRKAGSGVTIENVSLHDGTDVDMLARKLSFLTNGGAV